MHRKASLDALIVGAGPVGLAMAVALEQQGLSCRIIDQEPAPTAEARALLVWSRTMELLEPLGLADLFLSEGGLLQGLRIRVPSAPQAVAQFSLLDADSPYGMPLVLPQTDVARHLEAWLSRREVLVERSTTLTALSVDVHRVQCTLRGPRSEDEVLEAPWIIGCDGAHSTVRRLAGLPITRQGEAHRWLLADVHLGGGFAPDFLHLFWAPQGMLLFIPRGGGRYRVVADEGPDLAGEPLRQPHLAEVTAVVQERTGMEVHVDAPTWMTHVRLQEQTVADYARGRVLLAGDAAHTLGPAGSQGMNTGIQDAFNLAWKLGLIQRGQGRTDVLVHSYTEERGSVGDQVVRGSQRLMALAAVHQPLAKAARNHLAAILAAFPAVQDHVRQERLELSIQYRQSPLSCNEGPILGQAKVAGERLSDAPLRSGANDEPQRLLRVLDPTRLTVFLMPGHAPDALQRLRQQVEDADSQFPHLLCPQLLLPRDAMYPEELMHLHLPVWFDEAGWVHQDVRAERPMVLVVRPDGYIGYRGQTLEQGTHHPLLDYLRRFLIPVAPEQTQHPTPQSHAA